MKVETTDSDDDRNLLQDEKSSLQVETVLGKMINEQESEGKEDMQSIYDYFSKISDAAKGDCMVYYKKALQFSKNLPILDPILLYLNLNVAIYKVEVLKNLNEAIEDMEKLMIRIQEEGNMFKLNINER